MPNKKYLSALVALTLSFAAVTLGMNASAEVKSLPGMKGALTSKIYSGMYNVSRTRDIFYMMVESQSDPANDPILVWFNGGPGQASSI